MYGVSNQSGNQSGMQLAVETANRIGIAERIEKEAPG
jgi:hypothetical protein